MQILTDTVVPAPQAPPTQTPSAPTGPPASPGHHPTTAPPSKLPITGPSDVATGAAAIGLPLVLLGVVAIVVARRWRARTD